MGSTVQARLDAETQEKLQRLVERHGMSTSEVIREGIRLVEERHAKPKRPRLIGVGMFGGGPGDLSTNKKYMEDFGAKSMGKGWRRPKGRGE